MFSLVSSRYERASMIVTSNKPFSAWGEIRRRRRGRRDDRPARPPRRNPRPQRRQLPAQRQRPRRPTPRRTRHHQLTPPQAPPAAFPSTRLRLAPRNAAAPTLKWPSLQPAQPPKMGHFSTGETGTHITAAGNQAPRTQTYNSASLFASLRCPAKPTPAIPQLSELMLTVINARRTRTRRLVPPLQLEAQTRPPTGPARASCGVISCSPAATRPRDRSALERPLAPDERVGDEAVAAARIRSRSAAPRGDAGVGRKRVLHQARGYRKGPRSTSGDWPAIHCATASPTAAECLKPWPEQAETIITFSWAGWRSITKRLPRVLV